MFVKHILDCQPVFDVQGATLVACSHSSFLFSRFSVQVQERSVPCEVFVVFFMYGNVMLFYHVILQLTCFIPHHVPTVVY